MSDNPLLVDHWCIQPAVEPWYAHGKFHNRYGCDPKHIWYHVDYVIPREMQRDLAAQGILVAHNEHANPNTVYVGPVPGRDDGESADSG